MNSSSLSITSEHITHTPASAGGGTAWSGAAGASEGLAFPIPDEADCECRDEIELSRRQGGQAKEMLVLAGRAVRVPAPAPYTLARHLSP